MNGNQAYKILTNMELKNPCVCRYGKRLSQIWVSRSCDYGAVCYEAIITTRDNDPQREESIQLWKSELEDYLCQWDDEGWGCSYTTHQDMAAKGIEV
jgi:hypothetical protein